MSEWRGEGLGLVSKSNFLTLASLQPNRSELSWEFSAWNECKQQQAPCQVWSSRDWSPHISWRSYWAGIGVFPLQLRCLHGEPESGSSSQIPAYEAQHSRSLTSHRLSFFFYSAFKSVSTLLCTTFNTHKAYCAEQETDHLINSK